MQNLRIQSVTVVDSSTISVTFTDILYKDLSIQNVSILSDTPSIVDSEVLSIKVSGNTIKINCQPIGQYATYYVQFQSTTDNPFISFHGTAKLLEDGVANKYLIIGPVNPDNIIKEYLFNFLNGSIYNYQDDQTFINKYLNILSIHLAKGLYDIKQLKNENYLNVDIIDEQKSRGYGTSDRLNEESAYEIIRVGRTQTSAKVSNTFTYDEFPSSPVTLQRKTVSKALTINTTDIENGFNVDEFIITLSKSPVIKLNSLVFTQATANPTYTYDISIYGYQIVENKYDQDYAFKYSQLEDNQIKISQLILNDPLFSLNDITAIAIEYEYKDLSVVVDSTSVEVYNISDATREVLPPIINIFNLKYAPIVDSSNVLYEIGGLSFINPNDNSTSHPAFLQELPFRLNGLPNSAGQYSVDYSTGTVYVYGADFENDGTGPTPPLVSYTYRFIYTNEIDYVYDSSSSDLVALPHGNLLDQSGKVGFDYEEAFVPDVDYVANLHKESLNERVNNKLLALNVLQVDNLPVTNVFRVYNESTGEIYTTSRWNNNKVYFKYNVPPKIDEAIRERITFDTIINETLFINSTLTNASSLRVFKINLNNNNLVSGTEDGIGCFKNSFINFSDQDVFVNERYFVKEYSEYNNISILESVGQYNIDYTNGVIYVAVSTNQSNIIGETTYKYNSIVPTFPHITNISNIYYQINNLNNKNKSFTYSSFDDGEVVVSGLDNNDELYLDEDINYPYLISGSSIGVFEGSTFNSGVTNLVKFVNGVYEYTDLLNSTNPFNFASVSSYSDYDITVDSYVNTSFLNVGFDGSDYYVDIPVAINYLSANITYNFSVIRVSDSQQLWDGSGTVEAGNIVRLILSGVGSPAVNDYVNVIVTITINDLSRVMVDYNKGDFFIDYSYLADELLVSYEYGENLIDFRQTDVLSPGEEYYVSYKVGALRDSLLNNFGELTGIDELKIFDTELDRERYRDALDACLSSFVKGPTVAAIKNIGKKISHIEPEIIESIFQNWSLGSSLLNQRGLEAEGSFELLLAKYGQGVLVSSSDQSLMFQSNSNIKLETGTFETWVMPYWNRY